MDFQMAGPPSSTNSGASGKTKAAHPPQPRSLIAPDSNPQATRDPADLEAAQLVLRTAIEALSPDAATIHQKLVKGQTQGTPAGRRLSFGLVVVAAVMVFLILALDLLLTGL